MVCGCKELYTKIDLLIKIFKMINSVLRNAITMRQVRRFKNPHFNNIHRRTTFNFVGEPRNMILNYFQIELTKTLVIILLVPSDWKISIKMC